jgi:peroxiredoxin
MMRFVNKFLILLVILSFVLTACGGTVPDTMKNPDDSMLENVAPTHDVMMDEPMPTQDAMMNDSQSMPDTMTESGSDSMMAVPDWFAVSLTSVNTGETFTINDLKGKVVLVETMAVWCTNCFQQQTQVKALHEKLGMRDDFVSIGMDIDPNEDASKLQGFVEKNGFDWMYAVSPVDVSREISSLYGAQFLNPPSTPMLIIDRHGEAHPLPFGIKSADDLLAALQPYLDEAM